MLSHASDAINMKMQLIGFCLLRSAYCLLFSYPPIADICPESEPQCSETNLWAPGLFSAAFKKICAKSLSEAPARIGVLRSIS